MTYEPFTQREYEEALERFDFELYEQIADYDANLNNRYILVGDDQSGYSYRTSVKEAYEDFGGERTSISFYNNTMLINGQKIPVVVLSDDAQNFIQKGEANKFDNRTIICTLLRRKDWWLDEDLFEDSYEIDYEYADDYAAQLHTYKETA